MDNYLCFFSVGQFSSGIISVGQINVVSKYIHNF
jgi:hypothetical protein